MKEPVISSKIKHYKTNFKSCKNLLKDYLLPKTQQGIQIFLNILNQQLPTLTNFTKYFILKIACT